MLVAASDQHYDLRNLPEHFGCADAKRAWLGCVEGSGRR